MIAFENRVRHCLMVGLGGIGQRHLRNLRAQFGNELKISAYRVRREKQMLNDGLQVVPGGDVEAHYGVQIELDWEHALAQRPDAVFITNPSSFHMPFALSAAEAGCHLFIEKPLSHSLEGVEQLTASVKGQQLTAVVAYQLRFHPGFRRLKELLTQGVLGKILSVRAEVGEYLPGFHPYEDYRRMYAARREFGGGVTLSQIHEIDYLIALFGPPKRVFSMGGHVSDLEVNVEDLSCSLLEVDRGQESPLVIELHQDFFQRPTRRSCSIAGEMGHIEWSLSDRLLCWKASDGTVMELHNYANLPRNQLYQDELAHFWACVEGKEQPVVPLSDGAKSLEVALAILQSQGSGIPIALSSVWSGS